MSFQLINVRQSVPMVVNAEDNSLSGVLPGAVAAGSLLVVIGTEISTAGPVALLSSVADTSANTWGTPTNVRAAGSYDPNVFSAVAHNVAAGSPTVTLTLGAANSNTNKISAMLIEVELAPTASAVDKTVPGTAAGATSTSTEASGTLTQTDNLVILCVGGWFGTPTNPDGWTNLLTQMNGAYIGSLVCHKKVTSTGSIIGTVAHESAAATAALMLVIKAASGGTVLQYRFSGFDPGVVNGTVTGIEAHVWRNSAPYNQYCERYTGLTAGSGEVVISAGLPVDAQVGDLITAKFFNGTHFSPYVTGAVEVV